MIMWKHIGVEKDYLVQIDLGLVHVKRRVESLERVRVDEIEKSGR